VTPDLPDILVDWFAARGWTPHAHQLAMLDAADAGASALLIAPTGGGKTLAGFLPSLVDLIGDGAPDEGLHTLYISPLKALAVDIHRNLEVPIADMKLPIRAETRTGDTPQSKRQRQSKKPPHMLMTTPESLALLLSYEDAPEIFDSLRCVIIDELHAIEDNKRGDLLALGLSRLQALAPDARRVGLSATVADPDRLRRWLSTTARAEDVRLVMGTKGAEPVVEVLQTGARLPWSGHMGAHAVPEIYDLLKGGGTTPSTTAAFLPNSAARWKRPWCAGISMRWSPPPRSISGSTGPRSIWWCRWVPPRARRGCCNESAGPITSSTIRAGRCWFRPTGLKCSNVVPRWMRLPPIPLMACPNAPAVSMCWPSIFWGRPVRARWIGVRSTIRSERQVLMRA
jgi:hypothetical protein